MYSRSSGIAKVTTNCTMGMAMCMWDTLTFQEK